MRNTVFSSIILVAMLAAPAAAETLRIVVDDAAIEADPSTGQPTITLTLKPESKTAFGDFTRNRVGEQVTVRVGATPISAPFIREPILEGRILISGQMTAESASALVDLITAAEGVLEVDGTDK